MCRKRHPVYDGTCVVRNDMAKPVVLTRRSQILELVKTARSKGQSIGLVPTMGALHQGHASLVRQSASENDVTIATIFVNPKQFGPSEDFSRYPRTLTSDLEILEKSKASAVFCPSLEEMYPTGFQSSVSVPNLSNVLCGSFRPGHFDGVCTVVMVLLNLAQANKAYFGLKDFQQYFILHRMCLDLAHPTELVAVPTVREDDGLAMSSRNRYLNAAGRDLARAVPRSLASAARSFRDGERDSQVIKAVAMRELTAAGLTPQYLEIRDLIALKECNGKLEDDAVLALAQPIPTDTGACRLIDNIVLSANPFYLRILEDLIARTT